MPGCNGSDTGSEFARHESEQTSDGYFFARESVESLKKGKQMTGIGNRSTGAPFSGKPSKDCGCVSQRVSGEETPERQKVFRWILTRFYHFYDMINATGSLRKGGPLKCLSRVR